MSIKQTLPQAQAAQVAKQRLIDLAQDLNQVAATDPAAEKILREQKIEVKGPSK